MLRVSFPTGNYALSCQCVKGASFILFHSVLFGVKIGARLSKFFWGEFLVSWQIISLNENLYDTLLYELLFEIP